MSAHIVDVRGALSLPDLVRFQYDLEDRLLTMDSTAVTMVYDGDGNRVSKTAGGVITKFLVDDLTPTGYAQVAEELVAGAVTRRYAHGLQRISQTQLLDSVWMTHYYGYDGSASVRLLTDTTGANNRHLYLRCLRQPGRPNRHHT